MKPSCYIPFLVLITCSCKFVNEHKDQKKTSGDTTRTVVKSDFGIADSTLYGPMSYRHFRVITDTAFFYDLPDSLYKRREYILYDEPVESVDQSGEFILVNYMIPLKNKYMIGWLKASELTEMKFTPPVILKE